MRAIRALAGCHVSNLKVCYIVALAYRSHGAITRMNIGAKKIWHGGAAAVFCRHFCQSASARWRFCNEGNFVGKVRTLACSPGGALASLQGGSLTHMRVQAMRLWHKGAIAR